MGYEVKLYIVEKSKGNSNVYLDECVGRFAYYDTEKNYWCFYDERDDKTIIQ